MSGVLLTSAAGAKQTKSPAAYGPKTSFTSIQKSMTKVAFALSKTEKSGHSVSLSFVPPPPTGTLRHGIGRGMPRGQDRGSGSPRAAGWVLARSAMGLAEGCQRVFFVMLVFLS